MQEWLQPLPVVNVLRIPARITVGPDGRYLAYRFGLRIDDLIRG